MNTFHCQASEKDFIRAKRAVTSKYQIFIEMMEGGIASSVFLTKEDAAELGRYLIQLAEDGE